MGPARRLRNDAPQPLTTRRMLKLSPARHAWSVRRTVSVGPYYPFEVEEDIGDYSARL
jgi:hypothetical protein